MHIAARVLCTFGMAVVSAVGDPIIPVAPDPLAACNASFTICQIPENILLELPFMAIAGDAIVTEPSSTVVSDVFRIFNNIVDTGLGTGLGNMAFLYSSDDSTPLPPPSSYSANAAFISEDPSGITSYFGNGTNYLLGTPEPRTIGFLTLASLLIALLARSRRAIHRGDLL